MRRQKTFQILRKALGPLICYSPIDLNSKNIISGVEKEAEHIIEVGGDLLLAHHSILARSDLTKLLDSHKVISVIEASVSRTSLRLPPKIEHTHLKVPIGGLDSSAFTSISKSAVGAGPQLVVCSDGLGAGALLCAARLVKVKGLSVEKALAEVTQSTRRCNVPAGLRYRFQIISISRCSRRNNF